MRTIYRSSLSHREIVSWCEQRLAQAPFAWRRELWETTAGRTHVLFAGEPTAARTVVFVPGTSFNAASSLSEIAFLARRHRVVVADVPGQPGFSSERRPRSLGVMQLGSWLSEVVDRLAQPVVVVGHSLGAAIALSARSPHIAGRALISPAGIRRLRTPPPVVAATAGWLIRPTPRTTARVLRQMCAPGQEPTDDQVAWMTLVARCVRTSLDPGAVPAEALEETRRVPRYVATGESDVFIPPGHIRARVEGELETGLETLACGHLLDDAAWERIDEAIARL